MASHRLVCGAGAEYPNCGGNEATYILDEVMILYANGSCTTGIW